MKAPWECISQIVTLWIPSYTTYPEFANEVLSSEIPWAMDALYPTKIITAIIMCKVDKECSPYKVVTVKILRIITQEVVPLLRVRDGPDGLML